MSQGSESETLKPIDRSTRFLLWIDSIATVLVCPQTEVWIGQAVPSSGVHLAFQANLRRRHAKLIREHGSYWLEPLAEVSLFQPGGQPVKSFRSKPGDDLMLLASGQRIELGQSVGLTFVRPSPMTTTAVLYYTGTVFSGPQRTFPRSDYAVLMAEACLLGQSVQSHIRIPSLDSGTFFFKNNTLSFRSPQSWQLQSSDHTIARHSPNQSASVFDGSRLETAGFALTIEALNPHD